MLAASTRIFLEAMHVANDGITLSDPMQDDNPLVYVNQAFLNMTGYSEEEVIGRNCRFLQGPDTSPEAVEKLKHTCSQLRSDTVELINYRKDGSMFWNRLSVAPLFEEDGTLAFYVGIQSDITALKQLQERYADRLQRASMAVFEDAERLKEWAQTTNLPIPSEIQRVIHRLHAQSALTETLLQVNNSDMVNLLEAA